MSELDSLVTALGNAQHSVFRLEARQDYADDPQWQSYVAGENWQDNEDLRAWCELVRANTERGVTMQRVHVVISPWTPYVQFEVGQHYPFNQAAGEEVRLLASDQPWDAPDFWLVDDDQAWVLAYDVLGSMTVIRATDRTMATLQRWRDQALAETAPLGTRRLSA